MNYRNRNRTILNVEQLETRFAPATLVSPRLLTYQDVDGDRVSVTCSKPVFDAATINDVFKFNTGTVNGSNAVKQQLQQIDFTELATLADAQGANLTIKAVRDAVNGGDGFVNVGAIVARRQPTPGASFTGIDLGAVSVKGDLGRISVGDNESATTGLASLTVQSMGRFGTSTQSGGNLSSNIQGKLGALKVASDIVGAGSLPLGTPVNVANIDVEGTIDRVTIGGDFGGLLSADGDIGPVKIGGDVVGASFGVGNSGAIQTAGKLASITIAGSLRGGSGNPFFNLNGYIGSGGDMGAVRIGGDIIGGYQSTGGASGVIRSNGKLASLTVMGSIRGSDSTPSSASTTFDSGSVSSAGDMGPVRIGRDLIGGSRSGSNTLRRSGYIEGQRIASLTIGGSVIAGTDSTSGTFDNNGAIRAVNDIGAITIKGSLVGNSTNPVIISARGQATPTASKDLAIARLTVTGRVEYANILAGYDTAGALVNGNAQIGAVSVGLDWIASNLVAGIGAGADAKFGTADDTAGAGFPVASIASITIKGQVLGTISSVSSTDRYAFVARQITSLKVGGTTIPLTAGPDNDLNPGLFIGVTGDLVVMEV